MFISVSFVAKFSFIALVATMLGACGVFLHFAHGKDSAKAKFRFRLRVAVSGLAIISGADNAKLLFRRGP